MNVQQALFGTEMLSITRKEHTAFHAQMMDANEVIILPLPQLALLKLTAALVESAT